MQETLQKMLIMMLLLICMRSVCMQRSSRPARRGWGQGLSRRHGLSVWCGLSGSGTGVRISAGGPGLGWATPPPAPTGGYVHKGVLAGGSGGRSPPEEK